MDRVQLLTRHRDLLNMPYRLDPRNATFEERQDYCRAFVQHIDEVCRFIYERQAKIDIFRYEQDFWWVNDSKKPIQLLLRIHHVAEGDICDFVDIYDELLLECLYRMILTGKIDYIICADYRGERFVGYKTYRKRKGQWTGVSYVKYIR